MALFGGECESAKKFKLLITPIANTKNNRENIVGELENYKTVASGQAPLASVIKEVADILLIEQNKTKEKVFNLFFKLFKKEKNKPLIFLITDGYDSCGGEPIQEIKNANKEGIEFKMYVIGYSVQEEESENPKLPLLAKEAGGKYQEATRGKELQEKIEEATIKEYGSLMIRKNINRQLKQWELFKDGEKNGMQKPLLSASQEKLYDHYPDLETGNYCIALRFDNGDSIEQKIKIKKDQVTPVNVKQ